MKIEDILLKLVENGSTDPFALETAAAISYLLRYKLGWDSLFPDTNNSTEGLWEHWREVYMKNPDDSDSLRKLLLTFARLLR